MFFTVYSTAVHEFDFYYYICVICVVCVVFWPVAGNTEHSKTQKTDIVSGARDSTPCSILYTLRMKMKRNKQVHIRFKRFYSARSIVKNDGNRNEGENKCLCFN